MNKHLSGIDFKEACIFISLFVFLFSCSRQRTSADESTFFSKLESLYQGDLSQCVLYLDSLKNSREKEEIKAFYLKARKSFKHAEPILSFADVENYRFLNAPNILKVEEEDLTDIKINEPSGFQVLEELIYADSLDMFAVAKHADLVSNRLKLVRKNTYLKQYKPYHFLWMLRSAINRVALTGITGFDSPVLENSLEESRLVYEKLAQYLLISQSLFQDKALYQLWMEELESSRKSLYGDFALFDRYAFIKEHTHKQLALWGKTKQDWQVKFPFTLALNHETVSLFSAETFNVKYFDDIHSGELSEAKALLGKQLFNDPKLSASGTISCGSCHQQGLAFTDGKKKSDGQSRNSPTLTYAGLQQGFFYDKRSGSLEGQILSVVNNETEFHTSLEAMVEAVKKDAAYQQAFLELYEGKLTHVNIRNAMAQYIRSLVPFNSRFDRNISGLENTLTEAEIKGFNLFSGKAKCATCHFAPVFNGTVPPEFTETELELLGVPAESRTANASIDPDLGRYNLFKTEARKFFFKTPTVRNIALTAPYMHNGVYDSLEEVIDFYDRGGGAGIGIELENQTLPPDPLRLNEEEKESLIAFLHTLTDQAFEEKKRIP